MSTGWTDLPQGWACRSFEQVTRVRRYLDDGTVLPLLKREQRLYLAPPARDRLMDVARWTVNGHYRIEPNPRTRTITFRDDDGFVTTDPLFWCRVDGREAIECSLCRLTLPVDQPARLEGTNVHGATWANATWCPEAPANLSNDQMDSRVRWDGREVILDVSARTPFSLTLQTVQQGRFTERTEERPAGEHQWRFNGWFSDYVGLCLSAHDYEEKHILVGRFGSGSGRWCFDPSDGLWIAPPEGSRYRHRAAVVPWTVAARWDVLEGLTEAHEIEWWVHESRRDDLPALMDWARTHGIPAQGQVFGTDEQNPWWLLDPLDPVQAERFRRMPARAVMMVPFEHVLTTSWERVRAARALAQERPDHRVFETGWWEADGDAWNAWEAERHHRRAGEAAHGVGFMRPLENTPRAQIDERKRSLPRHPCQRCAERRPCAQRTPFPLPAQDWVACGGWSIGPLMGPSNPHNP